MGILLFGGLYCTPQIIRMVENNRSDVRVSEEYLRRSMVESVLGLKFLKKQVNEERRQRWAPLWVVGCSGQGATVVLAAIIL